MEQNQVVVVEKNGKTFLKSAHNKLLVGAAAALPLVAMAEPLDMTEATTQLGLGLAAVGALGAAKLAPAALSWVWGMVTRVASRGQLAAVCVV